ncbi:cysteine desulfurase [Erysipelotrichaceae bacterium]|nr:cysteine desulfurase [Erysipelotrichaceae bacterium]
MAYFDYASTTPVDLEVMDSLQKLQKDFFCNPDSHHGCGNEAQLILQQATKQIATIFAVRADEIFYTSGATEANNLALFGLAHAYENRGNHIITSKIEHASVLEPLKQLEKEGFEVTYLEASPTGVVTVEAILAAMRPETILVSLIHINNEVGLIQPIEKIGKALKTSYPRVFFHVDMAQSVGKIPIDLEYIDCATISGHKVYAPKGIGLLIKRKKIRIQPLFFGGQQQQKIRPGTLDMPLIVAFSKAIRLATERLKDIEQTTKITAMHTRLKHFFTENGNLELLPETYICTPYILYITVKKQTTEVETYLHALSHEKIYLSTRSTCHSKQIKMANPIVMALGLSAAQSRRGLRVSISHLTTDAEIEQLEQAFEKIIEKIVE